jgi:hypothetical protein
MDTTASPRDGNGRFTPGNPGGPGRSKGRGYELQQAAQEAITTHEMAVMMRKALKMGLEGNVAAMRFVAERTCGRPPEASIREPFDLELPPLRTVANCTAAIDRLVEATLRGDIDRDAGKFLLDLVQTRMKAIEMNEMEARLTELEKAAGTVDLSGSRNMRRM